MKAIVLLFTLAAVSFAATLDLDKLENELLDSPLVEVDPGLSARRFSFGSLFRKACSCEKTTCGCCAKPSIFGTKIDGCIKFSPKPESREINVEVSALKKTIVNKSFSTSATGNYCGSLPGKASFLTFCLETASVGNDQTGVTFCSQLNVNVKSVTGVSVNFRCVDLKEGKLSFSEEYMPSKNGILNLKARAVFKKVIDFIKRR
ncbi:uncharacterized protein [Halyomorpha halys]|uniref:uncharacterized protein n=1 Tax=Halyomorpha halys TaxID=286706 RepID=UPI0006D51D9E|nr:uncharacterized protein LOC106685430 [Halyomorpha halys]